MCMKWVVVVVMVIVLLVFVVSVKDCVLIVDLSNYKYLIDLLSDGWINVIWLCLIFEGFEVDWFDNFILLWMCVVVFVLEVVI